jgi:hypothetical protein
MIVHDVYDLVVGDLELALAVLDFISDLPAVVFLASLRPRPLHEA